MSACSTRVRASNCGAVHRCTLHVVSQLRWKWWRFPPEGFGCGRTLRQPQRQHNAQRTTHNCVIAAAIECSAAGEVNKC